MKMNTLYKDILKESDKLIDLVLSLKSTDRKRKKIEWTTGLISVSDLIAYQIGWGTLLNGWYRAGIKDRVPKMPGDGFETWDYNNIALHFFSKYKYDGSSKQLSEFKKIVSKILEIVDKELQNDNLDALNVWQWCTLKSGKHWPLSKWVKVNTVAPYKRASSLINKFLKKNCSQGINQV